MISPLLLCMTLATPALAQDPPAEAPAEAAPAETPETPAAEAQPAAGVGQAPAAAQGEVGVDSVEGEGEEEGEAVESVEGEGEEEAEEPPAAPPPPEPAAIGPGGEAYMLPVPADVMRRYRKLRLEVVDGADEVWEVRDGQGYVLDTHTFAQLTNDLDTRNQLDEDRQKGKRNAAIVAGVGAALCVSSIIPIARIQDAQGPDRQEYFLNPSDFESEEAYLAAQSDADARYELALGNHRTIEGRNEDRRWTSLLLVSAGTLTLAVTPIPFEYAVQQQRELTRYYTRDEANQRVEAYNHAVRARLGMPEPVDPPEEAPAEGAAAPEEQEARALPVLDRTNLQPVVGVGFVGIRGTF
ncbi:MAG: hypothetical protein H6739_15020 [Alphaproteobacteria bacterium]|nr:hypothetical protein [Alphaproteobacteria bacterium]